MISEIRFDEDLSGFDIYKNEASRHHKKQGAPSYLQKSAQLVNRRAACGTSMAPRALDILACCRHVAVDDSVLAKENAHKREKRWRRWTDEIKRKVLTTARRPRIWAVRREEPCDVDVGKQRVHTPERKVPGQQATPRRDGAPVLQIDRSPSDDDDGAPEAVAVDGRHNRKCLRDFDLPPEEISDAPVESRLPTGVLAVEGRRKGEGFRVRFDLPPQEISTAPVEPWFPSGVLGVPPESFAHSDAEMTAAFLMSVIAEKSGGTGSATQVDRDLVACWTERKEACSRRLRYLRDYCPFQREDEESELGTTTRPEAEPAHAEVWPAVKTGLPFESPECEAEFVKAIRSRYLGEGRVLIPPCIRNKS